MVWSGALQCFGICDCCTGEQLHSSLAFHAFLSLKNKTVECLLVRVWHMLLIADGGGSKCTCRHWTTDVLLLDALTDWLTGCLDDHDVLLPTITCNKLSSRFAFSGTGWAFYCCPGSNIRDAFFFFVVGLFSLLNRYFLLFVWVGGAVSIMMSMMMYSKCHKFANSRISIHF